MGRFRLTTYLKFNLMRKIYKINTQSFANALSQYPYVFSIRNYAYFFTTEEWNAISFVNVQPPFNANTQDLNVEVFEESEGVLKRRWVVEPKQIEVIEENQ